MTAPTPNAGLGFTEYKLPYPEPKSVASFAQDMCTATSGGFSCTREIGHDGDHQASGFDNDMFASWSGATS